MKVLPRGDRSRVSFRYCQGLMPNFLQVSVKLARIARALPPRSEPKNSQFFLPIAKGFTARSAVLLSIAQSPLVGVR